MNSFLEAKIYCLKSNQCPLYYIGSTCASLCDRLASHKRSNKSNNRKTTSKQITDFSDCYITLLEAYPCNNKHELYRKEGELQRLYKHEIVNKRIEAATPAERNIYIKQY